MYGTEQFGFSLAWTEQPASTAAERTRGSLIAYVGGRQIWGRPVGTGTEGFEWTWVELLEQLARVWLRLELEERDPLSLMVPDPRALRASAETRWLQTASRIRDREEQLLWGFEEAHDLARGIQGAWLPMLWILREGKRAFVWTSEATLRIQMTDALLALSALGDEIKHRLEGIEDARATSAIQSWQARRSGDASLVTSLATGLDREALREVERSAKPEDFWEVRSDLAPTEMMAAARMLGRNIDPKDMRSVLGHLRTAKRKGTPELDSLTPKAEQLLEERTIAAPHDDGYRLAEWFRREHASVAASGSIDPKAILQSWGVQVKLIHLHHADLDAIASWGPKHGPVILLNARGRLAKSKNGQRTTLAHEIAHLLVDRGRSLPLTEVLGGASPRAAEARANAFAAELLLPRSIVAETLASPGVPETLVSRLARKFGVSKELVAWQAKNCEIDLPAKTREYLRSLVSAPWRFDLGLDVAA